MKIKVHEEDTKRMEKKTRRPGNRKRKTEEEGEGLRTIIGGQVGGEGRDEDGSVPPSLPAPFIYS